VLEADGKPMSVRTALQLINRFFAEDDFDHDTQFCLHWFDQGWAEGKYGEADVLARAKGTSVGGLQDAGVVESGAGKLRLLRWAELPKDWSPETDTRDSDLGSTAPPDPCAEPRRRIGGWCAARPHARPCRTNARVGLSPLHALRTQRLGRRSSRL
jgi:hypothetical protein